MNSAVNSDDNSPNQKKMALDLATHHWGWSAPPHDVLAVAELSIQIQNMMTGEAVVKLGLLEIDEKDSLLSRKPQDRQTLDWLSHHHPHIRVAVDKIMTLRAGLQYFDDLLNVGVVVHPDMKNDVVRRCCESKRCVLGLIEHTTPVLCFGKFDDLERHRMAGRAEQHEILTMMRNPILAVGSSQRVTEWLAGAASNTIESEELDQKNLWLPADTRDSEPLRKFATLVDAAMAAASDIDIHPMRSGQGRVLLRVSTLMQDPPGGPYYLTFDELTEITRFLAKKSGANTSGSRIKEPRDGHLIYRSTLGETFIRASFIPLDPGGTSYDMLSVDLRLHRRKEGNISLHSLNMRPDVIAACEKAASSSQGLILFVGPTNTGKSTSMAGLICLHKEIHGDSRKRISIEQPVEFFLQGIKQISIPHKDLFASYFQAILRHDPDVVLVGEIRDAETADTAVEASLSGHLVISTLHSNDTVIGSRRLSNMIPPHKRLDLYEALELVISQRLIKTLCKSCYTGKTRKPTQDEIQRITEYATAKGFDITVPNKIPVVTENGCDACGNSGYAGVMPIHEVLPVTRTVKDLLIAGDYSYQTIGKQRTRTLVESALELVVSGKTTLDAIFI